MLLNCLSVSSKNSFSESSDTTITISIDEVRAINKKLIERKYLLDIVSKKDSIIKYQDNYINEEKRIVRELQDQVTFSNEIGKRMNESLKKHKVMSVCLGSALAISLLLFFIK